MQEYYWVDMDSSTWRKCKKTISGNDDLCCIPWPPDITESLKADIHTYLMTYWFCWFGF